MTTREEIIVNLKTVILRVRVHCEGCKQKVRRKLLKIEGVYSVTTEEEFGKFIVLGIVGPKTLIKKLAGSRKHAELWEAPQAGSNQPNCTKAVTVAQTGSVNGEKDAKDQKEADQQQQPKGGALAQLQKQKPAPPHQQQLQLKQQPQQNQQQPNGGSQALLQQKQVEHPQQQVQQKQQQLHQLQQKNQLQQQQLLNNDQLYMPNEEDVIDEKLDYKLSGEDDYEDNKFVEGIDEVYQPRNNGQPEMMDKSHQVPHNMLMLSNKSGGERAHGSGNQPNEGGFAKMGYKISGEGDNVAAIWGSQKGGGNMVGQMGGIGGQLTNVLPSGEMIGALPRYQGAVPGYLHGAGLGYPQGAGPGGNLYEQQHQQQYMAAMVYAQPPQANYHPAMPPSETIAHTYLFSDENTSSCVIM